MDDEESSKTKTFRMKEGIALSDSDRRESLLLVPAQLEEDSRVVDDAFENCSAVPEYRPIASDSDQTAIEDCHSLLWRIVDHFL